MLSSVRLTALCHVGWLLSQYFIHGIPCTVSGDPHFSLWNGARHDYQGQGEGQYYYIARCNGASTNDMPFSVLGKHTPYSGSTTGLEYLTLELFDSNNATYYLFFSASFQSYINAEHASGTLYDDNVGSPHLVNLSLSSSTTVIGERFDLIFTESDSSRRVDAELWMDHECPFKWTMQGQKQPIRAESRSFCN